jgi:hypothetical protein
MSTDSYQGWAILELMGHRRLAGYVQEQEIAGAAFLRLDVPDDDAPDAGPVMTQFYSAAAVYCLTPCTEQLARDVAKMGRPQPVRPWELPSVSSSAVDVDDNDDPDRIPF